MIQQSIPLKSSFLQTHSQLNHPITNEKIKSPHFKMFSPFETKSPSKQNESPYSKYFLQQSPLIHGDDQLVDNEIDKIIRNNKRSVNEAIILYKRLKSFHFFRKFRHEHPNLRTVEALIYLSKLVQYEYFQAGSVIYQKGENSNQKVYLVYSGEIRAWNHKSCQLNETSRSEDETGKVNLCFEKKDPHQIRKIKEKQNKRYDAKNKSFSGTSRAPFEIKLIKLNHEDRIFPTQVDEENIEERTSTQSINEPNTPILANLKKKMTKSLLLNSKISIISNHNEYLNKTKPKLSEANLEHHQGSLLINNKDMISFHPKQLKNQPKVPNFVSKFSIPSIKLFDPEDLLNGKSTRFIQRILTKGRHFGEKTLKCKDFTREESVIALTDCELLSFTKDDYNYLVKRFHSRNTSLLNFLLDCIPGLEGTIKYRRNDNFESHFKEESFSLHYQITTEKSQGSKVYLLYKGFCEIVKEIESFTKPNDHLIEQPHKRRTYSVPKKLVICVIRPGVFIGEEILFNEDRKYEQTVKASSSKIKVLSIDAEVFRQLMPEEVMIELKRLYLNKKSHNKKLLSNKIRTSLSVKDQTYLKFYPFRELQEYLPKDFNQCYEEQLSRLILLKKYESLFSRATSNIPQSTNQDLASSITLNNLENNLHNELSKFEENLHQYWRIGSVKISNISNQNNIRNFKENSVFKNKPYFKKLIEEKLLKGGLQEVPSPLKVISRVPTKSTNILNDCKPKQVPIIKNRKSIKLTGRKVISRKNSSQALNPSLNSINCPNKDHIDYTQIKINDTTSNGNITTSESSLAKINFKNNLQNIIDSHFVKTEGSFLLSLGKLEDSIEGLNSNLTLGNGQKKMCSILNLACIGSAKIKRTRKNFSFDLNASHELKKSKGN